MGAKISLIIVALMFFKVGYSQKEANNWYFGYNAGITFNTTPPSELKNGMISTQEGCATISTPEGRLLFYTDGTLVYDSTHTLMPNGSGLKGNWSTTQSSIIVPHPDSIGLYYIFTLAAICGTDGLQYSMVNMALNSGKGDIISGRKNIQLKNGLGEKMAAINHANKHDIWLVVSKCHQDSFFSFRIGSNGVNRIPIGYRIDAGQSLNKINAYGYLRFSPNGKKVAIAGFDRDTGILNRLGQIGDTCAVGDFNTSTGIISNLWKVNLNTSYGVEFSGRSRYLYAGETARGGIFQFDLTAPNNVVFLTSKKRIDSSSYPVHYALQLGPDGKIYSASSFQKYLSVIHAPDSLGLNCRLQVGGVTWTSGRCILGLPSLVPSTFLKKKLKVSKNCQWDSTQFTLSGIQAIDSLKWDFDDKGLGNYTTANIKDRYYHRYNRPGNYKVSLVIFYDTFNDTLNASFFIKHTKPHLGNDTLFCNSFKYELKPQNNYPYSSYWWSDSSQTKPSITIFSKGNYVLKVADSIGCLSSDTIVIRNPKAIANFNIADTIQCFDKHNFNLMDSSNYANDGRLLTKWSFGDGTFSNDTNYVKTYVSSGLYDIKLFIQSQLNCSDSITKKVAILPSVSAAFSVNNDTQCLSNNRFDFNTGKQGKHYEWNFGDGITDTTRKTQHHYSLGNTFKVYLTAYDTTFCKSTDSILLTVFAPLISINVDRDTQCFENHEFNFDPFGNPGTYSWNFGDGASSISKNTKHKYANKGNFKVVLTSFQFNLCPVEDSINVMLVDPSVQVSINRDSQCFTNHEFVLTATRGKIKYVWNYNDGSFDSGFLVKHRYKNISYHKVYLMTIDSFDCITNDTFNLKLFNTPKAEFIFQSDPCIIDTKFYNQSSNNFSSKWLIDTTAFNAKNLSYHFKKAGQYTIKLIAMDSSGFCNDTVEKLINITSSKKGALIIPNVFTPGNDNYNDCYQLEGLDAICGDLAEIYIYDRWGVLVYKGNLMTDCWNGKLHNTGGELPSGVYYFLLKIKQSIENGTIQTTDTNGLIHLIR